jgi:hypothetical protein
MIGYCDQAQGTNKEFYHQYRSNMGHNGHFDFPPSGNHDWSTWAPQLAAMTNDVAATINHQVVSQLLFALHRRCWTSLWMTMMTSSELTRIR